MCFRAIIVRGALIVSRSIHGDTRVVLTNIMLLTIITCNAFIISIAGNYDTRSIGTGEVFTGVDAILSAKTIIIAFTRNRDADVLSVADEVLTRIAFVALLTLILSGSIDDNAEVSNTCQMFLGLETVSILRTLVLPCSIYGDAGVALADVMLLTVVISNTFIGGISWNNNAGNTRACEVLTLRKTIGSGFTFIFCITRYRNTGIVFAN